MNKRLQDKVARAMYDCANGGDAPAWDDAEDNTRNWLLSRAQAAIDSVQHDLKQFIERNLTGEASTIGNMLIERLRG